MKPVFRVLVSLGIALSACTPAVAPTIVSLPLPTTIPPTAAPPTMIPATSTPTMTSATPTPLEAESKSLGANVDAMLQKLTDKGLFSGAVLVAHDGQIVLSQGYGLADRGHKIPNTPQTKFRIAQVTQVFTALAIMVLQEQGKLNVTDTVCQYLQDCPAAWKDITIQQLLTHTAGLPEIVDTDAYRQIQGEPTTPHQLITLFRDAPLAYPPGESFTATPLGFGASGYVVLGTLIDQVSGHRFESFVQQSLLGPLKLIHTSFELDASERAVGYFDQVSARATPHRIIPYAAGGLYSTVEDLHRLLQALAGDGTFSTAILDEVLKPQIKNPTGDGWDVGYGLVLSAFDGRRVIRLSGDMDGYRSAIDWYPDDRLMIIVLVNQENVAPFSASELLAKRVLSLK